MSYTVLQPIHLGSGEQGEARKRALEQIAEREGFTWGGSPSVGRWLINLADRELEKMDDLHTQAKRRVERSEALVPHADFILADWPEGDEHWQWVIEADEQEILDWVEAGQK